MIKLNVNKFMSALNKVGADTNKDTSIRLQFESNEKQKVCVLTVYNGTNLQIIKVILVEGEVPNTEIFLNYELLKNVISSYNELEVDSLELEIDNHKVLIHDEAGEIELPLKEKCMMLEASINGIDAEVLCKKSDFVEAINRVRYAYGTSPKLNGIFFEAVDGKYEVYACDEVLGSISSFNAKISVPDGKNIKEASFFAKPSIIKTLSILDGENLTIAITKTRVYIKDDDNMFVDILLNNQTFPRELFGKVIECEKTMGKTILTVDKKELMTNIQLISKVGETVKKDKVNVLLEFKDGTLSVKEEHDKASRKIKGTVERLDETGSTSVKFVVEYLLKVLMHTPYNEFKMIETGGPTLIKSTEKDAKISSYIFRRM